MKTNKCVCAFLNLLHPLGFTFSEIMCPEENLCIFTQDARRNESLFIKCNFHLLVFKIWLGWSLFACQKILFDYHGLGA